MLIGNAGPQNRRLEKHFQGAGIISGLKEGPQRESRVMTRVMKMEEKKKKKKKSSCGIQLKVPQCENF